MFVADGKPRCSGEAFAGGLKTYECGCPGYSSDPANAAELLLGTVSKGHAPGDLFDEPMFDEPVPWRPY